MAPGSWWPGPCLPLLYLFWNLNYPGRLDFHVSIQTESEVDCEFCYCGEDTKGSVRTAQREMDIGQFHWLSAKRSYLDFCSQAIDPWDILMISTEFRLGHLICPPVRDAVFLVQGGGKERWRGYTTPVPLASPCTCLSLLQSGAISPCKDRTPFSDIPDPTELSLPSSLLGTKLNDGRIFFILYFFLRHTD